jgi:Secretion system C-terminal sorting domain
LRESKTDVVKIGGISVYPVPSTGEIVVGDAYLEGTDREYYITNLVGMKLDIGKIQADSQRIDLSDISAGLYYFVLTEKGKAIEVKKIVIQH